MTIDLGTFPILSVITFLPLVGALVVAVIPRGNLGAIRWTALLFSLATWAASLVLLLGYAPAAAALPGGQFQFVEHVSWIPLFGIQYKVGVDGLSVAMVVLTTTLTWSSILARRWSSPMCSGGWATSSCRSGGRSGGSTSTGFRRRRAVGG